MRTTILLAGMGAMLISAAWTEARGRPAPPPSRYGYVLKFDADSLPKGITIRTLSDAQGTRHFIKNSSEVPLILHQRFQNDRLVSGSKLVSGKVYQYFPNGVPMEGKQHLKGWQAPFGDIPETLLYLANEPEKIAGGRKPGMPKDLPRPEPITIPAVYDGKPHAIRATVHYHLNPAYDAFHAKPKSE